MGKRIIFRTFPAIVGPPRIGEELLMTLRRKGGRTPQLKRQIGKALPNFRNKLREAEEEDEGMFIIQLPWATLIGMSGQKLQAHLHWRWAEAKYAGSANC